MKPTTFKVYELNEGDTVRFVGRFADGRTKPYRVAQVTYHGVILKSIDTQPILTAVVNLKSTHFDFERVLPEHMKEQL